MPALIDLSGRRFGRLTVTGRDGLFGIEAAWVCVCDCGRTTRARGTTLRDGRTYSCGCVWRDGRPRGRNGKVYSGKSQHARRAWVAMHKRCRPSFHQSRDYADRGITVCPEWSDFETFLADMGDPPSSKHTLDRKQNDEGYSPANCRWRTRKEQQRNMRRNNIVEHNGERHCVSEWAEIYGIGAAVVGSRLRLGWPIEKALTTPVIRRLQ